MMINLGNVCHWIELQLNLSYVLLEVEVNFKSQLEGLWKPKNDAKSEFYPGFLSKIQNSRAWVSFFAENSNSWVLSFEFYEITELTYNWYFFIKCAT